MNFVLIRHGLTKGNLEKRYIGWRSDEPLSPEGEAALQGRQYPPVDKVYVSPLLRCRQTARILYPDNSPIVIDAFKECDFGLFEGFNYQELNGRADYQAWIDSGGEAPFPGGESRREFAQRCADAFEPIFKDPSPATAAIVAHGGTIMAILERFGRPQGQYFDFQIPCGEGYLLNADGAYKRLSRL